MIRLFLMAILVALPPANASQIEEVNPAEVYPTQAVVGYLWVERKYQKFAALSAKELTKELREDPAPAIRGPGGRLYILDNHHEFYTLLELGFSKAYVRIVADYSAMSLARFYKRMVREDRVYLGDGNGRWTFTAATLPQRVAELGDDPYRALASFVRRAGGFNKVAGTHLEFEWAAFFRQFITLHMVQVDLEAAIERGVQLALSPEAAELPGFKGKKSKKTCERRLGT